MACRCSRCCSSLPELLSPKQWKSFSAGNKKRSRKNLLQLRLKQIVTRERLIAFSIFAFTLSVFLQSRIHQVTDSRYLMLVSESLVHHRTFTLDAYNIPRYPPES